jgi:hypothetical protein
LLGLRCGRRLRSLLRACGNRRQDHHRDEPDGGSASHSARESANWMPEIRMSG